MIVGAYHYSLRSLLDGLRLDTPLAHLGLVPFIALALGVFALRKPVGVDIHDRQLDWIVGLPLVASALFANLLLPARWSSLFWFWRVDLVTLPFFVAGVIALLFGVRTVWRARLAIGFLFLAWPFPYTYVIDRWLGRFTDLTIHALKIALKVIHVAAPVATSDGSLFSITHKASEFQLSVASACSGANGLLGFVIVGAAFLSVVTGTRKRKLLWLATGVAVVWALNVARILIIFAAAHAWGQRVALDGFHPYAGLVVFNLGVLLMATQLGRFGLTFPRSRTAATVAAARTKVRRPLPRTAFAGVLAVSIGLALLNSQLASADAIATSLGAPRLASFAVSKETPKGWNLRRAAQYDWTKRYFGPDSTWVRYSYGPSKTPGDLWSTMPVVTDIIDTDDRASLSAYGIEACYKFHGFKISKQQSVDLGNGLVGGLLTWTEPGVQSTWTTLYWHWPIKTPSGTRYERVTLLINDSPTLVLRAPTLEESTAKKLEIGLADVLTGSNASSELSSRLLQTRSFLVAFGREMIAKRAPAAA
jgi:exosortase/archaeosortase family protein